MAYMATISGCAAHKALMLRFLQFLNTRCAVFVFGESILTLRVFCVMPADYRVTR